MQSRFGWIAGRVALSLLCVLPGTSVVAQSADWSGGYLSLDTTYSRHEASSAADGTIVMQGASAGVTFGYWFSAADLLLGLDGRIAAGGPSYSVSTFGVPGPGTDYTLDIWAGPSVSVRAKVGAPLGALLPYIAAGAVATRRVTQIQWDGLPTSVDEDWFVGATMAGGIEARLNQNIGAIVEVSADWHGYKAGPDLTFAGYSVKGGLTFRFQ